jgi:hypothetical protein
MYVKQISVFVENKFGHLEEIISLLGENDIDISALSLADTTDFGILRMIVSDTEKALEVLRNAGNIVKVTDVIAIAVKDAAGGLASALHVLKNDGISIEYLYAFIGKSDLGALVVLRTEEPEKAIDTLRANNITVLSPDQAYRL